MSLSSVSPLSACPEVSEKRRNGVSASPQPLATSHQPLATSHQQIRDRGVTHQRGAHARLLPEAGSFELATKIAVVPRGGKSCSASPLLRLSASRP